MDDPFFEATISSVRGFDLGDDRELLASLEQPEASPTADDLLLRAVLRIRIGRFDDALADLDRAALLGHAKALSEVHYLRARLLSRTGRTAVSGEALDAAERATLEDHRIPEAEIAHARGLAEWEAGRPDDALVHVNHGLSLDDGSAARWRDKGSLLIELSRADEAGAALGRALALDPADDVAMVLHAFADAALGRADAVADWIDKALHLAPSRRESLAVEPRLSAVRVHPAVARLLEPPPPADPAWMDELAGWISALRYAMQRPDQRKRHPVEWLDRAESRRIHDRFRDEHRQGPIGTMHSAATLDHAMSLLDKREIIGRGASLPTREGAEDRLLIALDPSPYGELWVAPSDAYPPFLWLPAGRDASSLCRVLDELYPRPQLRRVDMTTEVRGFIGYRERIVVPNPKSGHLEAAGEVELDRYFTLNPFVESAGWGSAFTDDPWPDEIPDQPGVVLKIERRRRELAEQAHGAVWSMTRRLRHSRGYLSYERHHGDVFTAVVRYVPANHRRTILAVNGHFGTDYPLDMPVDAVAALLGFQFDGSNDLEGRLAQSKDAAEICGLLMVISALRHSDLDAQALYRKYAQHEEPDVRATICTIAVAYNFEALLELVSVSEPDPELRAEIEAVLDEGIAPPSPEPSESIQAEIAEVFDP